MSKLTLVISYIFLILFTLINSVIIDTVDEHSWGWHKITRTNPDKLIDLIIAVKQTNVDELIQTLMDVSTPSNDKYGQHLSNIAVQEMVKPLSLSLKLVKRWIYSNGIHPKTVEYATTFGDFIRITNISIGTVERMLNCEYYDYSNNKLNNGNTIIPRVDHESNYHVPNRLANHIDFISPTLRFPAVNSLTIKTAHNIIEPDAAVTPSVLKALYNVGKTEGESSTNIQGVASFLEQYYDPSDLPIFWNKFGIDSTTVTKVPSNTPNGHGIEAELDVEYVTAMGEKIATQVWYTAGRAPNNRANEPFLTWLLNVENATNPPNLFSVSYGETETSVGISYGSRVNTELAKLGTMGISVLFASGDSGAGGNCTASKGQECPNFPTGSPFVTSVGGVTGGTPGKFPPGEKAWIDGGGGFSNYWGVQSWQKDAVTAYLNSNVDLPKGKFNESGRAYPDVSAQSVDYEIVVRGNTLGVSGTSCSTPTTSGIFSLLNDLRIQNNMSPLGFLNPFIYETAAKDSTAFNDCTLGYNDGCGGKAFPATDKWDAASGWGSPNYGVLAKYVLQTGQKTIKN